MKRQFLSFALLFSILAFNISLVNAQCVVNYSVTTPGIDQDSNWCFTKGTAVQITWQFKNYTSIDYFGNTVMVDSVSLDTIYNLPCGINWTSNQRVYADTDNGCIYFWGTTNDTAGSYKLDIGVTAYVHGIGAEHQKFSTAASALGAPPYVNVLAVGASCTPPDTTTADDLTVGCEVPYAVQTGINNVEQAVTGIGNHPNPFSGNTMIVFNADDARQMTFRVYDLLGNTLHEELVTTAPGRNTINFNGNGMSSGLYFYSITDGKQTYTNKMVISQ